MKQKLKRFSEGAAAQELRAKNFKKDKTPANHRNPLFALDR